MRSSSDGSNMSDLDERQYLNGRGSILIMPALNKKSSRKNRLKQHLKTHSASYLILVALAVTVLVIVHIEKEYQSNLNKAFSQSEQLKTVLKQKNTRSEPITRSSPIVFDNNKEQTPQPLSKQPEKVKEPVKKVEQIIKVNTTKQIPKVNSRPKQTANIVSAQLLPDKFKSVQPPKVLNGTEKNGKLAANTTKKPNFFQTKPVLSQNPPKQISRGSPPPSPSSASKAIAGVSAQQREKAQKWVGLKDQNIFQTSALADQERNYYQQKYNISQYDELPICIVIPSYNNVKDNRHLKNIKSVVMQEYSNYHIVFIDDASSDGTADQIQAFLVGQNKLPQDHYVIIKNKEQKRAMPNLRRAAKEFCKPEDIFIIVDGDDQLLGRQVLKFFNAIFQSKKPWFVYSNFLTIRGSVGYSRPFPQSTINSNKYRTYPFVTSHLRAFYTQLFINIKEADLQDDQGNYLKAANDVAICIPILQMSHERVMYVPELTYYYNSNTGQNNHQLRLKQQKANDRMLRKRKSYTRLDELPFSSKASPVAKNTPEIEEFPQSLQISKNVVKSQQTANKSQ